MAAEAEELLREVARYSTVLRHISPLGRNLNPKPFSAAQEQTNTTQESTGARRAWKAPLINHLLGRSRAGAEARTQVGIK